VDGHRTVLVACLQAYTPVGALVQGSSRHAAHSTACCIPPCEGGPWALHRPSRPIRPGKPAELATMPGRIIMASCGGMPLIRPPRLEHHRPCRSAASARLRFCPSSGCRQSFFPALPPLFLNCTGIWFPHFLSPGSGGMAISFIVILGRRRSRRRRRNPHYQSRRRTRPPAAS
jgi:hypothetical protein